MLDSSRQPLPHENTLPKSYETELFRLNLDSSA